MKKAGSFVVRYAIPHHFENNTVISSNLSWNYFTITWGELKVCWLFLMCWLVFEKRANSSHLIIQPGLSMSWRMCKLIKNNNKITKFEYGKFDEKQNGKRAQASTLQQQVQIQIPN